MAACQLSTSNPLSVAVSRPYGADAQAVARVLISRPPANGPNWRSPCLAASLDQRLLWWRMDSKSTSHRTDGLHSAEAPRGLSTPLPAGRHSADAAAAAVQGSLECNSSSNWLGSQVFSDPQLGHTAFVDALVEVPAGNSIGYASGSRDKTIRLWSPFSSSSRTPSGMVRPLRTLRGHTGSITALLVLPAAGSCSSNSTSSASWAALLASASADRTVKLWSLAGLAPCSSSGASVGKLSDGEGNECAGFANNDCSSRGSTKAVWRGSSSSSSCKRAGQMQQCRNPLLATFRGHSDCVTDLLLVPQSSSSGGACKLLSSSRDCRVKLWDPNRQSCVSTWKLPAPCYKLLDGLDVGSCVAAVGSHAFMLLDIRMQGSNSSASAAVLRVQWPSGTLDCASAYGSMLAGGGRKGVRVWDVRAPPHSANSATHGSGCHAPDPGRLAAKAVAPHNLGSASSAGSSRVLFSAHMPDHEPVTAVHLSRVRLVAATSKAVLHSPASIAVWSVPSGQKLNQLSSTGSAINLQDLGSSLWGEGDNADDAWELIQALSEPDADNALSLIHQQRLMQQEQQQAAGGAPAVNALDGLPPLAQLQPQQPLHAAVPALPSVSASDDDSGSDAEAELSVESDASTAGMAAEDDGWKEDSAHSSTADNSSWGRLEPGVVALAANGPVIATVDTLGNVLLRDFRKSDPKPEQLLPYCTAVDHAASIPNASLLQNSSSVSSAGSNHTNEGARSHIDTGAEQAAAETAAAAAVAAGSAGGAAGSQHPLKFWRA